MRIEPTGADRLEASDVHRLFSAKPNSQHIASEFALAHVAALLRTGEIGSVLEFGAGIGTVTYLLLSILPEDAVVACTETDKLCLASLEDNLPPDRRKRLTIHTTLPPALPAFDLVIVDGDISPGSSFLKQGSICFAEGNRSKARSAIELSLNERGLTCPFTNHVPPESKKGCWIGRVEPLASSSSRDP